MEDPRVLMYRAMIRRTVRKVKAKLKDGESATIYSPIVGEEHVGMTIQRLGDRFYLDGDLMA